jgi:hypothetical protein
VGRTYVRSAALLGLLVVLLVVLVLAYPLADPGGPAAVSLLTAVLVVPWMVAAERAFAHARTSVPSRGPSDHREGSVNSAQRPEHRRSTAVTRTGPAGPRTGLPIGLTVGALVMVLVAGAVEIALPVVAVVLLVAAHVLRRRARRALFERFRHPGPDHA